MIEQYGESAGATCRTSYGSERLSNNTAQQFIRSGAGSHSVGLSLRERKIRLAERDGYTSVSAADRGRIGPYPCSERPHASRPVAYRRQWTTFFASGCAVVA